MFGTSSAFRPSGGLFGQSSTATGTIQQQTTQVGATHNPMKDFEVTQPPDDSIQALKFSPASVPQNFLVSGSWDSIIRVWEVKDTGQTEPKAQQTMQGPVLEVDWSDDGSKIFAASADRQAKMWDLGSNQFVQVGQHETPIKTCHWIKASTYSCLMTGGWDKTLKFWDLRNPQPIANITIPERVYCVDVVYPMAIVCTAQRGIIVYNLENQPAEVKKIESPLKYQHRCVAIFKDAAGVPTGFALGSTEGRVAIHYVSTNDPKNNFTFKCHRSPELVGGYQDIYAVNDIAFHPTHGTLATVGSDGRFSYWDKDARTKLKTSEKMDAAITRCCFNKTGQIFAYSVSYDWSKGHEFYNASQKNYIFLHNCFDDLKPRPKK